MAVLYPDLENIARLKVKATDGELHLIHSLTKHLSDEYEIFFNPYLNGDRPDIIILKKNVAAFVIEVKDWDLKNYKITDRNKWHVFNNKNWSLIKSPQQQVFHYKKNLYELHLPVIGLSRLKNRNFYNIIKCYNYFHFTDEAQLKNLFSKPSEELSTKRKELNEQIKRNDISQSDYDKLIETVERNLANIRRDSYMSFAEDTIHKLIKKIKETQNHVLFNDDIYQDFKRRLKPPEHTLKQGIPLKFDDKQQALTISKPEKSKIKGVAGCGKTSIMAQRAVNAVNRHQEEVLLLTYNITLKNYIEDKLSDAYGRRSPDHFCTTNYHEFFTSQANELNIQLPQKRDGETLEKFEERLSEFYRTDIFAGQQDIFKFKTILIDEIQDYEPQWVKIIRDNFLNKNGEMVLFGDESQNIYDREATKSPVIAQGFGRWIKLTKSYRTTSHSPLTLLFKDFQSRFLLEKYSDAEIVDIEPTQLGIGFNLIKHEVISTENWLPIVTDLITSYIKLYELHPNDLVILSTKIETVRDVNDFLLGQEETQCMFESFEELSGTLGKTISELKDMPKKKLSQLLNKEQNKLLIKSIRRAKKNFFMLNSGKIKLSTTHSYKGLEAKTVFFLMDSANSAETLYTSITRATDNLVILNLTDNNEFTKFFASSIKH